MTTHAAMLVLLGLVLDPSGPGQEPDPPGAQVAENVEIQAEKVELRALSQRFDDAFNAADADALAELFAEDAEVIDEGGNLYRGRATIAEVFASFFEGYPGATITREIEELRLVGSSLAIEDGAMTITAEERGTARNRYLAVLSRIDDQWRIASMRQVADDVDELPSPHDRLEPLAWLVGEWVSEESEQPVSLSCRWSDDENFLLIDYTIGKDGASAPLRTTQRIGWDAAHQAIRSWNFDSDGGFSEGRWATDGAAWVVKSELVLPDGLTGWATFYLAPKDEHRFTWGSVDRVVGGLLRPDVEVTIVRKPPEPR